MPPEVPAAASAVEQAVAVVVAMAGEQMYVFFVGTVLECTRVSTQLRSVVEIGV